jgi:D-alanine-D-alanine ligase
MNLPTNPPILLLYNIDHCWTQEEIHESEGLTEVFTNALRETGHQVIVVCLEENNLPSLMKQFDPNELLVFNWCEGVPGIPYGWALAANELERSGFTFTGANSQALELGQDKRRIKRQLDWAGIPTPLWQVYTSDQPITWACYPAIVKPAFEHCSFGITREAVVQTREELSLRISYILEELQQPAIVEEFIDGREFHVGVIGNGSELVLPPAEIDFSAFNDIHDRLCTYEANYDKSSLAYQNTIPRLPAILTSHQLKNLHEISIAAYRLTGCRDYARMDIRLRNGVFYVLDVNHNADLSPDTSIVMAAELMGYSYGQFGSLLINLAAKRHPIYSTMFQADQVEGTRCLES